MGHIATTKCLDCGEIFDAQYGGGFGFDLLRCDRCGETKSIGFEELGDLKGASVEPISEDDYHHGIEAVAGNCACGGTYALDAPPRCPKCHSTRIEEGEIILYYD